MPVVQSEVQINAAVETVYALAKDIERFPELMPDVEHVKVLEREGGRTLSEWVGLIPQLGNKRVKWKEVDEWDDLARRCVFQATEGDFNKYEGTWDFESTGATTNMRLVLDFELNVPLANGPIIRNVVKKLVQSNCDSMCQALKRAAER